MLEQLHPTDQAMLALLSQHRFATTKQLARLAAQSYASPASALRQASRHLKRLTEQHLVLRLERRVGGWQAGSAPGIWTLTTSGARLVHASPGQRRPSALSTTFIDHLLAITETRVTLTEITRTSGSEVSRLELEPDCWRTYLDAYGAQAVLKPDLFVEITGQEFTDSYFVEVDRETENPARVLNKCHQYVEHYRAQAGSEEVYPAVLWVVPTEYRCLQLNRYLRADPRLPGGLFTVTTIAQLPDVIAAGPVPTSVVTSSTQQTDLTVKGGHP